jgi:esterase/lipase
MGGTIATYLAGKYGCDKLVLISTAFEYINAKQNLKDLSQISQIAVKKKNFNLRGLINDIDTYLDIKISNKKPTFKTYRDFYTITKYCNKHTPTINVPVRIFHGENDEVIPLNSSINAFKRFKSLDKQIKIIPNGRHVLLRSKNALLVEKEIVNFLSIISLKEPVKSL